MQCDRNEEEEEMVDFPLHYHMKVSCKYSSVLVYIPE